MSFKSALYEGLVMHQRLRPRHHSFQYRVFAMLIDLDELPVLDRTLPLFGWNRWALLSFRDRDHGPLVQEQAGTSLRAWLDGLLAGAGIAADGPCQILCYPRILGYVFNPLSVWFCRDRDGALQAIVYEVHNTYGERHAYVLPATSANDREHRPGKVRAQRDDIGARFPIRPCDPKEIRHACAKDFYVSPFLSNDCRYAFRILPPTDNVVVAIQQDEAGAPVFNAAFTGERRALTGRSLAAMLLRYPLMTLKVVFAIHFEAVRLMLKGIKRHPHAPKESYQKPLAAPAPRLNG